MMQSSRTRSRGWIKGVLVAVFALVAVYLLIAYVILPLAWRRHEKDSHSVLDSAPKVTHNRQGIPGDPLNVALVGDQKQLIHAMLAAGWKPADATTLESSIEIATSVVLDKPDPNAPVSNLYVFDRKQDLAFEQEVGSSADQRHHVRWWKCPDKQEDGRPVWVGDASFDIRSGISHDTGQITHHIDPDVDAQRDQLMADLEKAGQLERQLHVPGIGPTQDGRNAGGDRYYTDGMMSVGVLAAGSPGS